MGLAKRLLSRSENTHRLILHHVIMSVSSSNLTGCHRQLTRQHSVCRQHAVLSFTQRVTLTAASPVTSMTRAFLFFLSMASTRVCVPELQVALNGTDQGAITGQQKI